MARSYTLALVCGAVPLGVGTSVFVIWLATRAPGLVIAGLMTIYAGLACFGIGILALARFRAKARSSSQPPAEIRRRTRLALILLLANFPVAAVLASSAHAIETRYEVSLKNRASVTLSDIRLRGGGVERSLGDLEPGGVAAVGFWIQHDGELRLEGRLGARRVEGVIDGYVTGSVGARTKVTVHPDASIEADWEL